MQLPLPQPPRMSAAERKFWLFHFQHPEVYTHLCVLCREWLNVRGRARWSINGAFEVLRWQRYVRGLPDPNEDWKLNNNYRSRYARLMMEQEADLTDFFEIRELHS